MNPIFVVFCIPSLSYQVSIEHYHSMLNLQWLLFQNGISFGHALVGGDPYLPKVRSKLVTMFLKHYPHATHLFFLDDDVGFDAEAALKMILLDKDFVAGVYPKKNDKGEWPCELVAGEDGNPVEIDGLLKALNVPTGFMCLRRRVLESFVNPDETFMDEDASGAALECYNIFRVGYSSEDHRWWGEDFDFCRRWLEMSGEIWVKPDINFTHRGTKIWGGKFLDAVEAFKENQKSKIVEPELFTAE